MEQLQPWRYYNLHGAFFRSHLLWTHLRWFHAGQLMMSWTLAPHPSRMTPVYPSAANRRCRQRVISSHWPLQDLDIVTAGPAQRPGNLDYLAAGSRKLELAIVAASGPIAISFTLIFQWLNRSGLCRILSKSNYSMIRLPAPSQWCF